MAEEHKSRLGNIIGVITAITGLIAALLGVASAIKPGLLGGPASASAATASAPPPTVAGNQASPVLQARVGSAAGPARPGAALPRAGGGAVTGGDVTTTHDAHGEAAVETELAPKHEEHVDADTADSHPSQDPEE